LGHLCTPGPDVVTWLESEADFWLTFVSGECKAFKETFMKCLRENSFDNSRCRLQSKNYLECRMDNQLMAKEPLEKLGFRDLMDPPPSPEARGSKP
ncbi:cytochrome c oxidase assembly protein COX19, partial [Nothobranchius furzeri]